MVDTQSGEEECTTPEFVHGFNLRDPLLCHNVGLDGRIRSTDFSARFDAGIRSTHRLIDEMPIEDVASARLEGNAIAPRVARYVIPGVGWAAGMEFVDGFGEPVTASEGKKANVIEMKEVEIAFEEGRRRLRPAAPSRLSCIWLAERSPEGVAAIQSMLGAKVLVAEVKVTAAVSLVRADVSWFDDYLSNPKPEYIDNYWKEVPHPTSNRWEWLLDGMIELAHEADLATVRRDGAKFFGSGPAK